MKTITGTPAFYDYERMSFSPWRHVEDDGEFMIGYYEKGEGTDGEFRITLHRLGLDNRLYPKLGVFSDSIDIMLKLQEDKGILDKLKDADRVGFVSSREFSLFLRKVVGLEDFSDEDV